MLFKIHNGNGESVFGGNVGADNVYLTRDSDPEEIADEVFSQWDDLRNQ